MGEIKKITDAVVNQQEAKDLIEKNESKSILFNGYKEIIFDGQKVYVRFPRLKEKTILEKDYSLKYLKMIRENEYPTMRMWRKELENKGMWTEQDEEMFVEAQKMYMETYKEWYSFKYEDRVGDPEFAAVDRAYTKATLNYMKVFTERESMFSHTIEKIVENEQILKQVQMCVFKEEDGKEVQMFKSISELENYPNGEAVLNLVRDCTTFWMGVGERFLEQLPESISGNENTN